MSTLQLTLKKLRDQIADCEAVLSALRLKLAQAEAKITGQPIPLSGLDALWAVALPIARNRSSKHACRKAWALIPRGERPTIDTMVSALKVWNRCAEWKQDGNQFVPALDRWIRERRWEALPEVAQAGSRYRNAPTATKPHDPTETITDPAEVARLLGRKPKPTTKEIGDRGSEIGDRG
jgi:hypothetical protein